MENGWTERIEELTESRDHWKREWSLLNAGLNMAEARIKELEDENKRLVALNDTFPPEIARLEDRVSEEYEAERADDRARIQALEAENKRLSDLLWGARCVFCGEVIGKEKKNQDIADEVLRQHIKSCPKHPLTIARARIKELEHNLEVNGIDFSRKDGD